MKYKYVPVTTALLILMLVLVHCRKDKNAADDRLPFYKSINPSAEVSELSRRLVIKNGTNKTGNAPVTTVTTDLQITIGQESASITNDNVLFIPFLFSSSSQVSGIYLQLKGADNHWQIKLDPVAGNVYVAGIGIPPRVSSGVFEVLYKLYDAAGKVGNEKKMTVTIVPTQSFCGTQNRIPRVEGEDGLTVRTFDMGNVKGKVKIFYDTYTVKDRIDIRYNGKWIRSTGALLSDNGTPPIKPCNLVGNNDGFVGTTGTFEFDYDPSISRKVDVYVSGCLDGGTLWYFDAYCPDANAGTEPEWYDGVPDCPCDYETARKLGTTPNPAGTWKDFGGADPWYSLHDFHYGAVSEVRWLPTQKGNPGQQCTYDSDGDLITAGIAAGSPDKVSPDGMFGLPGGHWDADMKPWWTISCVEYLQGWPSNNDNNCPSNTISGINHMLELVGDNMTCKEVVDMFKEAAGSSATDMPESLKKYILGTHPNIYGGSNALLLQDLKRWQTMQDCEPGDSGNLCQIIQKAITNVD
jgi:hypothetical protein